MKQISISVRCADALQTDCDVLILKYAQALHGVDRAASLRLEGAGIVIRPLLPKPDRFRLFVTDGAVAASRVLFVGVPSLGQFDYAGIRAFATRALASLAGALPSTRFVALTIHGVGFGLDEFESFRAELAGLLDAFESGEYPENLEVITIIDRDQGRVTRLNSILEEILPSGEVRPQGSGAVVPQSGARAALTNVGEGSRKKPHIFTAMPFAKEFNDRFHYGIQRSAEAAGFLCERVDLASFVGNVLDYVRERIDTASFVVADLTTANPNVYLEVGYAWGRGVPTVLLVSESTDLKFDTKGQRCLVYESSIRQLEDLLTKELTNLASRHSEN
jgi:hypothetical protein